MKTLTARRGIAAVLFAALFPVAGASRAGLRQVSRDAAIHIWIVDLAGLPPQVRAQAEETVADIFRAAGVEVSFVECLALPARPCLAAPAKNDFWLQILARRPSHTHPDATGFTMLTRSQRPGDSYAAVSYPMAQSVARELDVPLASVLGAAMAHEIGHLLLDSPAHSRTGIMSPRLDRRQFRQLESGELHFTEEEARRLVERARALAK